MPGIQELLVIAVVALLVFGPDRLPEFARTAGQLLGRFRAATQGGIDELKKVAEVEELDREIRGLRRELRETRSEVVHRMRSVATTDGPGVAVRADGEPPPSDPEAT
jgi:sec-independent protein translocase protein TatB